MHYGRDLIHLRLGGLKGRILYSGAANSVDKIQYLGNTYIKNPNHFGKEVSE